MGVLDTVEAADNLVRYDLDSPGAFHAGPPNGIRDAPTEPPEG